MIIKKITDVENLPVNIEGAEKVRSRLLFGHAENAPTFAMRLFELAPTGHTPFHTHTFEHEIIVVEGDITLLTDKDPIPLRAGNVVMVMAGDKHSFQNASDSEPAKFFCMVPIEHQQ